MIQIIVNGQILDLTNDVQVSLNYTSTDFDNPATNFGEYSKQFTVPKTPKNAKIFGNIDQIDSTFNIINPKDRVECVLLDESNTIITKGYLQISGINVKNGITQYNVTFFSNKCDFFYNLQYDTQGNEKKLHNLYYGFVNNNGDIFTPTEENQSTIVQWSSDWIYNSWTKLNNTFDPTDKNPNNWITAAPTYSGLYDDFKNDTVIYNNNMPSLAPGIRNLFNNKDSEGHFGSGYGNWWVIEGGREMSEWETKDFRAKYQRPAVRTKLILDAISNPENNGGYEVEIDPEFKNSEYYNTFTLLNRIDFSESNKIEPSVKLKWLNNSAPVFGDNPNIMNNWNYLTLTDESGNTEFDGSTLVNPNVKFDILPALRTYNVPIDPLYNKVTLAFSLQTQVYIGGLCMQLCVFAHNQLIANTPYYYYTTTPLFIQTKYNTGRTFTIEEYRNQLMEKMGININFLEKEKNPFEVIVNQDGSFFAGIDKLSFFQQFANDSEIQVVMKIGYWDINEITYAPSLVGKSLIARYATASKWEIVPSIGNNNTNQWKISVDFDTKGITPGVYEGDADGVKSTNVTKELLFGNELTPYKYLLSLSKLFGLKYEVDNFKKKINIKLRKNYYKDNVIDLSNKLNMDEGYSINNILTEKKYAEYGLETPKTYAEYLYLKKNSVPYASTKIDTKNNFNSEIEKIFDSNSFKQGIPYYLNSMCFQNVPISGYSTPTPAVAMLQKYTTKTWLGDDTIENEQYGISNSEQIKSIADPYGNKICCFDKDNKNVDDLDLTLVFFNGFAPISGALLSDDLQVMYDIVSQPCFILSYWYNKASMNPEEYLEGHETEFGKKITQIPLFQGYKYDANQYITDSLDFSIPNSSFVTNITNYSPNTTIYNRYWEKYLNDLYSKDTRELEIYVDLPHIPINDLIENLYYIQGNIWVLNKITDYNITNKFTKCNFVKVQNKANYLS